MSQNIGTLVSSAIRPNNSLDPIASAYSNELKGGVHSYNTITERNQIIIQRRQFGMLVYVISEQKTYQLTTNVDTDLMNNSNWDEIFDSSTSANTGEWINSVLNISIVEPGTIPTSNDRYLLGTASGITLTGTNWGSSPYVSTQVVEWDNTNASWQFTIPTNGMTVRTDIDNSSFYKYEGNYPTGFWRKERITDVYYIEPSTINGLDYTVTTIPTFSTLDKNIIFLTKFSTTNIGSVTLNINGIGYKTIKKVGAIGLEDITGNTLRTDITYSISYNGTYFQLSNAFNNSKYIEYYVGPTETITIKDNEQYWVYGDLTIEGVVNNNGKIVIANGGVILQNSGVLNNLGSGEVILVDLFNTPIYNNTPTIQFSKQLTVNGPSVSAIVRNKSLTASHLNTSNYGNATASYILSADSSGYFKWITNSTGMTGATGATGPQGINGATGIGLVGPKGATGAVYATMSTNYIVKANGTYSLLNSQVYDNGVSVIIGATSGTEKLEVIGNVKATAFIKTGGTSSEFLKADGSVDTVAYAIDTNALHIVNNESWIGIKSSSNAGPTQSNGLFLASSGTTITSTVLNILNSNAGSGIYINNLTSGLSTGIAINNLGKTGIDITNINNGSAINITNNSIGDGITITNNDDVGKGININNIGDGFGTYVNNISTGTGIYYTNNFTGKNIYSLNNSSGDGIHSYNSDSGIGIHSLNYSTGHSIVSDTLSTGTGFNYIGRNNGVNTFTVDKFGNITGNSFIKSGGSAIEFLLASGITTTIKTIEGQSLFGSGDILLTNKQSISEKNIANGYPGLGADGKIFSSQLPALAITDTYVVSSQVDMLGLTTSATGDVAVRTDLNKTFILKGATYSILGDWQELLTPTDTVTSVFGRTGVVVANSGDYTTALVTETTNKRYQTDNQQSFNDATSSIQTQINTKAPLISPALTGVPTAPTATAGTNTTQIATTAFVNTLDATALHKTGDETFTGIKSSTNTGTSQINGISLTNNGTGVSSVINVNNTSTGYGLRIDNSNSGRGIISINTGSGSGIEASNSTTGYGLLSDNNGAGKGIFSRNYSTGNGIEVTNISTTGTGLKVNNQDAGYGIIVTAGPSATGLNYIGQNNGTNTFTVDKLGNVTGNSFVKSGGTSAQFLKADGSVDSVVYAPLASPALTGTPTAPTATVGTNTTQIATTAFVITENNNNVKLTGNQTISNQKTITATDNISTNSFVFINTSASNGGALIVSNTAAGRGAIFTNSSAGRGLEISNAGTGFGLVLLNTTTGSVGSGFYLQNNSPSKAFELVNASTGIGININATAGAGFSIVGQDTGVNTFTLTREGVVTGSSFVKSGGTSAQFLKADGSVDTSVYTLDSASLHKTGNETFTGIKTSVNTGTTSINGLSLTNNSTGGASINGINSTTGDFMSIVNGSTGVNTGQAIRVNNNGTSIGIGVGNNDVGIGIYIQGSSSGDNLTSNILTAGSGYCYVGQNNGTTIFTVDKNGNVIASGNVTAGSDARIKTNIRPLENSLVKILNISGVKFDRLDNNSKNQIGFIAQDLEKEFPELVHTADTEEGMKSVNYQNITAVLVECIKELKLEIEELKKSIK